MTDRPPWVANRIADLALEAARDQRTLARIRALTARALEAGLLLDPAEVEAVLDGAWCPLCLSECGHSEGGHSVTRSGIVDLDDPRAGAGTPVVPRGLATDQRLERSRIQ